jgi:transposase IS66 family protein
MNIPLFTPKLPVIPDAEQTPLVKSLLQIIAQQQEQIQRLEDEIRRLKGGPQRPPLKPSSLEPAGGRESEGSGAADSDDPRRRGPRRQKTAELTIHLTERVSLADVPAGSRFKGYRRYVVQELDIRVQNTCFLLEQWQLPTGEYVTAPVPLAVQGGHYGPQVVTYVLHQYYHAHVTQPLLLEQLHAWGIEMSAGQLNHVLRAGHERFHEEKAALKAAGLAVSRYFQADDTGARHQGRNGYCTYIGNDLFAWFASTEHKTRVNFLELLQTERRYEVNAEALASLAERGLAACHRAVLAARPVVLTDPKAWATYLHRGGIDSARAVTLATEGALLGGLVTQGFRLDIGLVSDDAGQFDLFAHGLCWVHAERPLQHLLPLNELDRRAIEWVRQHVWTLYRDLKAYRQQPDPTGKAPLTAAFESLCATKTTCEPLNQVLQHFQANQAELLRVLERPELPLHNNRSENDRRDMVKKRKISAGTRSETGRRCRDTFASLKKTCRKQGLSFWEYLKDRVSGLKVIPPLAELIRRAAVSQHGLARS